jgi:hypothetical protein
LFFRTTNPLVPVSRLAARRLFASKDRARLRRRRVQSGVQISLGQPAISYSKYLANFTRNPVVPAAQNANTAALISD